MTKNQVRPAWFLKKVLNSILKSSSSDGVGPFEHESVCGAFEKVGIYRGTYDFFLQYQGKRAVRITEGKDCTCSRKTQE